MEYLDALLTLVQTAPPPGPGGGPAGGAAAGGALFLICVVYCGLIAVGIAAFAFWLWALIDCASNYQEDDKTVWILLIIFVGAIGSLLYVIIARPKMRQRVVQIEQPAQIPEYPPYRSDE